MPKPLSCHNALEIVDPPSTTPITLTEVKRQLRVEGTDDDATLTRLIRVAVAFTDVTGALGQAMITQKWAQWIDSTPPQTVNLILGPVQGVTAVKYFDVDGDLQTDTLSNYEVTGTKFATKIGPKSGFSWPVAQDRQDAIKIEYEIGYGDATRDVPETVRHALLMLVAHWYENREPELIGSISKTLPFGFDSLLNMHRNCWYG